MSHSQIYRPPTIGKVTVKKTAGAMYATDTLAAGHIGDDWFVWTRESGLLVAMFSHKPNVHGWSASEAHARSFLNRSYSINPFELDSIA